MNVETAIGAKGWANRNPMKAVATVSLCVILSACASGSAKIASRVQVTDEISIARLFVYANVKSRYITENVYGGLRDRLKSDFSACGVAVEMLHADPLELDMKKKIDASVARFQADSILSITRTGGQVLIGDGGNSGNFDFKMKINEKKTGREVWTATSDVRLLTANMFTDDRKSGERIASGIVAKLRTDGLLKRCTNAVTFN